MQISKRVMENCRYIQVVVLDDDRVRNVMLSEDEVLRNTSESIYVAIHSTILSSACIEIAERVLKFGVKIIDAPISGGPMVLKRRH